jgi:hypothetical protein
MAIPRPVNSTATVIIAPATAAAMPWMSTIDRLMHGRQ